MNDVLEAAAELQSYCQRQGWRFCFIGGIALLRWGEPRETVDADLTLLTGFGGEEEFVDALLEQFAARIPNAAAFALDHRVLLLRAANGVGLDVALGGLPFEESVDRRSSEFTYPPNIVLRTCSAEDLIVMKAFAGRGQDWVDVERVCVRQEGKLDWNYIFEQLRPLAELKGELEILQRLERVRSG